MLTIRLMIISIISVASCYASDFAIEFEKPLIKVNVPSDIIEGVNISPDCQSAVATTANGDAYIVDSSHETKKFIAFGNRVVSHVRYSRNGHLLAVCFRDGLIRIFERTILRWEELKSISVTELSSEPQTISMAFIGTRLLVSFTVEDIDDVPMSAIHEVDIRNGQARRIAGFRTNSIIFSIDADTEGDTLVLGQQNEVTVIDAKKWKQLYSFPCFRPMVHVSTHGEKCALLETLQGPASETMLPIRPKIQAIVWTKNNPVGRQEFDGFDWDCQYFGIYLEKDLLVCTTQGKLMQLKDSTKSWENLKCPLKISAFTCGDDRYFAIGTVNKNEIAVYRCLIK